LLSFFLFRIGLGLIFYGTFVWTSAYCLQKEGTLSPLETETARHFRDGDLEALRAIVQQYQEPMYRLGLRILGQSHDAQDFVQALFLHLFEKRRHYDPQRPFNPWLYRVAVNLARQWLRQRREIPATNSLPEVSEPPQAEGALLAAERDQQVRRALLKLKPIHREVLGLRFSSQLSLGEMAEVLGLSLGTVKSRLSRALASFHQAYISLGGDSYDLP
jgi:RNA polymerase sigma-70 factor (ECF subfamily)